jgi:hypothetical protein
MDNLGSHKSEAVRQAIRSAEAIGEMLDAYTAEECANYFKNAGYGQT